MSPYISIAPIDSLVHENISIVINNLSYQNIYKVELRFLHKTGTYRSFGVFKSNVTGCIDLSKIAPLRGSYAGVNERGLFESLEPTDNVRYGGYCNCTPPDDFNYLLMVIDTKGRVVCQKHLRRRLKHPSVERKEIETSFSTNDETGKPKITGTVFKPPGDGPFPTIIDISGTGGGLNEQKDAINYITSLPYTNDRIGFQGVSFGGTLVMLFSTKFPKIKAVCSINGSFSMDEYSHITVNGVQPPIGRFSDTGEHVRFLNDLMVYADMVRNIKLDEGAEFDFESSSSDTAFRFVSALDDMSTPTIYSTNLLTGILRELNREVDVDFVPGGHLLDPPCFPHHPMVYSNIAGTFQTYGGETSLHGKSEFDVWERTVQFFSRHLGAPTPLPDYLRHSAKL
uniref:Alpha/beta-hydrolase n=1 Tax=Caenorhabditis tropicalis TaxID=1561998 RepID=A0A1I7SZI7_9PELO